MDEFVDSLLGFIQQLQEDIDDIEDDEFERIMDILQELLTFAVQSQQQEDGAPLPEPEGPLKSTQYPSSNINAFRYDPESKKLLVKFMGKDTADSGPTYSYDNVPSFIVDVFARGAVGPKTTGKNKYHAWFKGVTPSHGAAMHSLIKMGGFPYRKVA